MPERYARCHPEQTPLYRIGTRHLEIWLAERSLGEHPVAVHIEEELRSYLRCGILSFGSALNRHVLLHVCVTDGFFCSDATGDQEDAGDPSVRFFAARPITPGDLDTLHRPRAKPTHSVVQTRGTARRCGRGRHARMEAQWAFDRCKRLDQSRRSHDNSPIAWAKLLARIAEAFPLECPVCGGDIRLIAFITEPGPIRKILTHLGEPLEPPPVSPARGPPIDWGKLVQIHDDREAVQASPDELPVIDIHSL